MKPGAWIPQCRNVTDCITVDELGGRQCESCRMWHDRRTWREELTQCEDGAWRCYECSVVHLQVMAHRQLARLLEQRRLDMLKRSAN